MAHNELNTHNEIHTAVVEESNPPQEEQSSSLLEINGTLLFVAISFIIFTILMKKVFYGPLSEIRQKRKDYLKGIKTEAQHNYEESEKLKKEYSEKILTAKQKASERTLEAMNEANQEKDKILEKKKQEIEEFLKEGRQKIEEEKYKTFVSLRENISGYAYDISKKILNEEIPITGVSSEVIDKAINR